MNKDLYKEQWSDYSSEPFSREEVKRHFNEKMGEKFQFNRSDIDVGLRTIKSGMCGGDKAECRLVVTKGIIRVRECILHEGEDQSTLTDGDYFGDDVVIASVGDIVFVNLPDIWIEYLDDVKGEILTLVFWK